MEPLTKYNLSSACIRRILEINDKALSEHMIISLNDFVRYCEEPISSIIARTKQSYEILQSYLIGTIKIYKPFIPSELLIIIFKNFHTHIYEYILSENLHIKS
jgi:hypothetical protein